MGAGGKAKRILLVAAKILVSGGLIWWLLRSADLATIGHTVASADRRILLVAFLVFFIGYFITAARWKLLLHTQGVASRIWFLVQSFAIAVFFNNFLPSTVGGDVYRMYDSWRLGAGKTRAVSVVLVDRIFGLFALLCYALAASLFVPEVARRLPGLQLFILLAMAGIMVIAWLAFGGGHHLLRRVQELEHPLFRLPLKIVNRIAAGFELFRGRRDVLLKALGFSFLLQLNVVFHYWLITAALGLEVPFHAMFLVVPLALLLMMLPVSINGIGLRETVFVFLLGLFAVSREQAIAFAWISFGMILAQGVIGGIVFMVRRPGMKLAARQRKAER